MNKFLEKNITKIILIFLILGPIFDLGTSLLINLANINFNFIIIIKILFMAILLYYLTVISKSKLKKYSLIYLGSLFMYIIMFLINTVITKDLSVLSYELQNVIRGFFFPICLVSIYNIYQEKKFNIDYKILSEVLIYYLALIFIPLITNTGFDSYAYSKVGSTGWFNSTNEIGGILSILLPFLIIVILKLNKNIYKIISFLIIFFIYFSLGSKVPVLALTIIMGLYIIKYLISLFNKKNIKKIILIFIGVFISIGLSVVAIPKTSFYKNIVIHLEFLEIHEFSDLMTIENIDHFVFSSRIKFMEKTKESYNKASISEKILGIGYIENYATDDINTKTIEMDYYDVFYRYGILGFIIYFIPFIYIIFNILKKLKLNKKSNITFNLSISVCLILLLSLFSGHILLSPSVSIYVIAILIYFSEVLE